MTEAPPSRVAVAGASGAGKTALAVALAEIYGLDYHDIDALYYGPEWTPRHEFGSSVAALSAGDRWITEWIYEQPFASLLSARAELIVWLDYSRATTLTSLVLRTLLRRLHHEVLWAGNREPTLTSVLWNDRHVLRYGLVSGRQVRASLQPLLDALESPPRIICFRRPADASSWLLDERARVGSGARR